MKILVVCTGNSCRSQIAEGLIKNKFPDFEVFSAGTHPESNVNPYAVRVMQEKGIDISDHSLKICKINAYKLGVKNRVKLFKSDIDNFNIGKYDLIISNPPYIKKLDFRNLKKDILIFEPWLALDGGLEGLSCFRKIIKKSSELIKKRGKLILEIACDQKKDVVKILRNNGFYINKVLRDLANNDRCIISTKI